MKIFWLTALVTFIIVGVGLFNALYVAGVLR